MPRPLVVAGVLLAALTLLPLAWLAIARHTDSPVPRLQIVYDMDDQPKVRAQAGFEMFEDGRGMREPVEGTVARDARLFDDPALTGKAGESWLQRSPLAVDAAAMQRGRDRFDIFCAACHGESGRGDGLVHRRATELAEGTWTPPTDITTDPVAVQPDGQLYHTITHGIRTMPGYASQIPVEDRWAIVAYVRALQRSVRGSLDDVPAADRAALR